MMEEYEGLCERIIKLEKAILGAKVDYEADGDGRRSHNPLARSMYDWLSEVKVPRDLEYWDLKDNDNKNNEKGMSQSHKDVLKELLQFTKRFTNMTDQIIYESQNNVDPIKQAEDYLEDE